LDTFFAIDIVNSRFGGRKSAETGNISFACAPWIVPKAKLMEIAVLHLAVSD
jgi:hypothetical protein